jgi:hypothetical protein
MQHILSDIATTYSLARKSGKWVGPCPKCGGSTGSDKFNIRDDGGFKCYACDFKGDIITWLREMDGKSCPEAHEAAGMDCRSVSSCPASGTCRLGTGTGATRRPARSARTVTPPPAPREKALPIATVKAPEDVWLQWAEAIAASAAKELPGQKAVLTWLAARGIDAAASSRFGLGWLAKNGKVSRAAIGLPPREDGKETIWIPAGLVIRINNQDGTLHRLRIRRPSWAREKFLPDLKYVWIEGSGTAPMVIRPQGPSRGVVVVEAELDAMAVAAAHQEVTVIALGSVSTGLPPEIKAEIAAAPVILLALDADPGKDGKPGAGPAAIAAWQHEFRQAKFWPVPAGKDPGDYVKTHSGNLHAWVEAGLIPPAKQFAPPAHDAMSIPVGSPKGGEGVENTTAPAPFPDYRIVTLTDGREIHVVADEGLWKELAAEGKLVFSENEMKRLQVAMAGCGEDERVGMVNAVLDVKGVFSGAYIRRGGDPVVVGVFA